MHFVLYVMKQKRHKVKRALRDLDRFWHAGAELSLKFFDIFIILCLIEKQL